MARENEIECLNAIKDGLKGTIKISFWNNCNINKIAQFILTCRPNVNSNNFPEVDNARTTSLGLFFE